MKQQGPEDSIRKAQDSLQEAAQRETAPEHVNRRRTLIFQSLLLAAIAGFAFLAYLASTRAYTSIDVGVTKFLQTYDATWLEYFMRGISWIGYMPQAVIIAVAFLVILWISGFRLETIMTAVTVAGVEVLNLLIKASVHRPRPSADLVRVFKDLTDFSFPSGHVMFYVALFGFMAYLTFSLLRQSWKRTALLVVFTGLVVLVGLSRIFLGEHWASDVLGAYLAAGMWLAGMIEVYRQYKNRQKAPSPEHS